MERVTDTTSNEPVTRDVRRRLRCVYAQEQAAAPIGRELVHVDVCFESRPGCLEISAQQEATTGGRVIL